MSNDLATIMANSPDIVGTGVDDDTRAVAGASRGSKRLSLDGGVFRKIVAGKEVGAIEDRHMNIIFVKMAHDPSRQFYNSVYQKGVKTSPVCWSSDSKMPDEAVKAPLAPSCDKCEKSVKGSGNGGVGTACRMSWRTAVVLPNDPAGDVLQFVIPATSSFGPEDNGRWPFRPYVQMLANNNVSAGRVITKMQFDTKSSVPRVLFNPAGAVPTHEVSIIMAQGKSNAAEKAVELTVFQSDEAAAPAQEAVPEGLRDIPRDSVEPADAEPVLREADKPAADQAKDVNDVLKKWSKKK